MRQLSGTEHDRRDAELMNPCHLSLMSIVEAVHFYSVAYICFACVEAGSFTSLGTSHVSAHEAVIS